MQEAKKNLGLRIRNARQSKGYTQERLAEHLGIQARTILEIENGRGNPQFDVLFAMIRFLDIPAQEIFYFDRMTASPETEKLLVELSAFSEEQQKIAVASARAVLSQIRASSKE